MPPFIHVHLSLLQGHATLIIFQLYALVSSLLALVCDLLCEIHIQIFFFTTTKTHFIHLFDSSFYVILWLDKENPFIYHEYIDMFSFVLYAGKPDRHASNKQ